MTPRAILLISLAFAASAASLPAQETPAPPPQTATPASPAPPSSQPTQDLLPAILPTDRLSEPWWAERHQRILATVRQRPEIRLLLIGDSITQNYEKSNPPDEDFLPIWQQFYEPRQALNLGFSGDTTANVLWRLTHGEIDGLRPQAAVVLIGTNNTGHAHQTAEQTEAGISNIVGTLTQRLPQTRILLLGILPSDVSPEKTAADQAINAWLAQRYGAKTAQLTSSTTTSALIPKDCHPERALSERSESMGESKDLHSGCAATTASSTNPQPQTSPQTNSQTSSQTDPRVIYLDISSIFKNPGDALNTAIFYDPRLSTPGKPLHPDTAGQRKMAEAIEPTLAKMMYDKPRTTATSSDNTKH